MTGLYIILGPSSQIVFYASVLVPLTMIIVLVNVFLILEELKEAIILNPITSALESGVMELFAAYEPKSVFIKKQQLKEAVTQQRDLFCLRCVP